jgi:predicted transposase/invertase (TIGR01784 family)
MAAAQNPEIRKAVNTLYELSADEKVRAEYETHLRAVRDRAWLRNDGYQEGLQNGIQEGLQDVARRMKTRGRPLREIAEDTGLSLDEIKRL